MRIRLLLLSLTMVILSMVVEAQTINYPRDRFILDLGAERWSGSVENYNEQWYSHMFAIGLFKEWAGMSNGLSLAIGGDLSWHNYHSDLYWDEQGRFDLRKTEFSKNKITTFYADLPVEFRFRGKRNSKGNYFRLYLGAKVGYNLGSWNLYVDPNTKYKLYQVPGLEDWRYGIYARTGWSYFSFYAQYMISPMFEEGHPIEVQSFSFGISLMAF